MAGQIQCPHCGQVFGLTDEQIPQYAGQTITCTKCQQAFTVPAGPGGSAPATQQPSMQQPAQAQRVEPVAYASAYYQPQKSNPMAVISVVCGSVGLIIPVIFSLVGLILGIIGLGKTRDPQVGGKGLAITGISLSGASLLMGGCMLAVLMPSLNRARETANRVKCAANMKSIGQGLLLYANENRGAFPPRIELLITEEGMAAQSFVCPTSFDTPAQGATPAAIAQNLTAGGHLSYLYFGAGLNTTASARTVLLCEPLSDHNGDGINALFGDGHVEFISAGRAQSVLTQLQAGTNPPR